MPPALSQRHEPDRRGPRCAPFGPPIPGSGRFDGKPGSAARAAELKFGKVLPQVHCAEALYPLDVEVPAGGGATLAEAAREALRAEAGRVAAAEVAFGAALPPGCGSSRSLPSPRRPAAARCSLREG